MTSDTLWIESDRISGIQLSALRQLLASAPKDSINLALGELGYDLPQGIKDYACNLLQNNTPRYTENAGLIELRNTIAAAYYPGHTAQNVCVCNGAEEALYICMQAFINPGDIVAIPDPDYPAYPVLAEMAGAKVIRMPFAEDFRGIDWDKWESMIASGVKLFLFSHPSNPTGFVFSASEFDRFAQLMNKYQVIVVVDEIYHQLYFEPLPIHNFNIIDRLIRIDGLSKSHLLSGWRIGWISGEIDVIKAVTKTKQYISTCTSWLSQKVAAFAIQSAEIPDSVRQQLSQSRSLCINELDSCVLHIPTATPYLMMKLKNADMRVAEFIAKGVITVPGSAFGTVAKDWIRINFAIPDIDLLAGLRKLR